MSLSEKLSQLYDKIATFFRNNKKTIYTLLAGVIIFIFGYVFLKYLMPLIYPFVVAYVVALILQPIINFLSKRAHFPKKLSIFILVIGVVFLIGFLIYKTGSRLYYELKILAANITSFVSEMNDNSDFVDKVIEDIASKIPFIDVRENLRAAWTNIDEIIKNALSTLASNIANIDTIIPAITKIASFVPKLLIDTIIVIVSAFYFSHDFKKINGFFAAQLPDKVRNFGKLVKTEFTATTGKYIKAYSLIILITFAELFVGFTILDVRYAFIFAFFTAIIDILPVLGTGTILIPWAIYSLIIGDVFLGVGLLILYLVITVVRQIMEPKIVGTYIGLYPLVTLICMYVGAQLMGVVGLFLFPITIIILKNLNDAEVIKLWKNPPPDENDKKTKEKMTVKTFLSKVKKKKSSDDEKSE